MIATKNRRKAVWILAWHWHRLQAGAGEVSACVDTLTKMIKDGYDAGAHSRMKRVFEGVRAIIRAETLAQNAAGSGNPNIRNHKRHNGTRGFC